MKSCILIMALAATPLVTHSGEKSSAEECGYISYVTVSPFDPDGTFSRHAISIDMERKVLWRGHAGEQLKICKEDERNYCFESLPLSFSVPKQTPEIGSQWVTSGFTYSASRKETIDILGVSMEVIVIESRRKGEQSFAASYYYSPTRGLVGISAPNSPNGEISLMLSTSGYGFPCESRL